MTVTGPQTLSLGSLPQAQLLQYSRYLWHSTAGLRAQSLHHQQKPSCAPSASELATVYTSTSSCKNFNIIFRAYIRLWQPRHSVQHHYFACNKAIDINHITNQHLHRQYICTQPQQQAWAQQEVKAHRFALPLCAGIQATGLVNIQRVTSHNNPADGYTKCVTSPVLERHLRDNGIIELHIKEGRSTTSTSSSSLSGTSLMTRKSSTLEETTTTSTTKVQTTTSTTLQQQEKRRRTRSSTYRRDAEKQHNEQTSSTSSHKFYFNIKFDIEHNNHRSS